MSFIFYFFFYITLSIAGLPVLFNFYREREYFRDYLNYLNISITENITCHHCICYGIISKILSFETSNNTIKYHKFKNYTLNDNQHIKFWMMKKIAFTKVSCDITIFQ